LLSLQVAQLQLNKNISSSDHRNKKLVCAKWKTLEVYESNSDKIHFNSLTNRDRLCRLSCNSIVFDLGSDKILSTSSPLCLKKFNTVVRDRFSFHSKIIWIVSTVRSLV
jgi:hypothetical protein